MGMRLNIQYVGTQLAPTMQALTQSVPNILDCVLPLPVLVLTWSFDCLLWALLQKILNPDGLLAFRSKGLRPVDPCVTKEYTLAHPCWPLRQHGTKRAIVVTFAPCMHSVESCHPKTVFVWITESKIGRGSTVYRVRFVRVTDSLRVGILLSHVEPFLSRMSGTCSTVFVHAK